MRFCRTFLALLTALGMAIFAGAVAPNPYTLGVSFSFRIAGVGNAIMTVYAEPGDSMQQFTINATTESDIRTAWMKPNQRYLVHFGASGPGVYDLSFIAPDGYRMYINDVPTDLYTMTPGGGEYGHYHWVELRPINDNGFAPAGSFSGFQLGKSVTWFAGLGGLRNGRGAGTIMFKERDLAVVPPASRDRLYYSKPANSGQIYVLRDGPSGQRLRQIKTAQTVVDLVDDTNGYWIKYYSPSQASGPDDESTLYTFTGEPWKKLRVESPGTDQLKITETELPVTRESLLTAGSAATGNYTWTLREGLSPNWSRTTTHTSTKSGAQRDDVVTVQTGTGGTAVTKTRFRYTDQAWGEELTEVLANPDAAVAQQEKTTYTYHGADGAYGNYRRLQSITGPMGDWVSYKYHDAWDRRGQLEVESHPWLDAPATWQLAAHDVGRSIKYTYDLDFNGRYQIPASREEYITVGATTCMVARSTMAYAHNQVRNGQPFTMSWVTGQFDGTSGLVTYNETIRPDLNNPNPDYLGLSFTRKSPNQAQSSFTHHLGSYNPATKTFTYPGDLSHFRTVEFRGSSAAAGGTVFDTYDGHAVSALYLIPNRSTAEITIRNPSGNILRTETHVYTGGTSFAMMACEDFTYDPAGRLLTRAASNGAASSNSYSGGRLEVTVDPAGTETSFTYDELGRTKTIKKIGAAASGDHGAQADLTTTFTYDGADRIKSEVVSADGTGETITNTANYDAAGRPINRTPAGLGMTEFEYDATARTQKIIAPGDDAETIRTFHRDGQLRSLTGSGVVPTWHTRGVESDGRRFLQVNVGSIASPRIRKSWADWLGRHTESRRAGFSISSQADFVQQSFYDGTTGNLTHTTRSGLAAMRFEYDTLGAVVRSGLDVDSAGGLVLASMDRITDQTASFENISGSWWARTQTTIYPKSNDATGFTSTRRVRMSGHVADRFAEVQDVDLEGNVVTRRLDVMPLSKLATITTEGPCDCATASEVAYNGLPSLAVTRDNLTYATHYDALGRKWKDIDPRDNAVTTAYETGTRLVLKTLDAVTSPGPNEMVTFSYDDNGRVEWTRNAGGYYSRFGYNTRGQMTHQWGDGAYPLEYGYDPTYGDRISVSTFRAAPAGDSPTWPTVGAADTTTFAFDAASGLLWKQTDALTRIVEFDYNVRGQTASRRWARKLVTAPATPVTTSYVYDGATGELTNVNYNDDAEAYPTTDLTFTYTRLGQEKSVVDVIGTRTFTFDTSKPWRLNHELFSSGWGNRYLSHLYESTGATTVAGRYSGLRFGTTPTSSSVVEQNYTFNPAGRIATLVSKAENNNSTLTRTYTYVYEPNSSLVDGYTMGNFTVSRDYEEDRDLPTRVEGAWGGSSRARFDYTYNGLAQRISRKQSGSAYGDYGDATFRRYTYNPRGELTAAPEYLGSDINSLTQPMPGRQEAYDYDSIGNRNWADRAATPALRDDFSVNALNQYISRENNRVPVQGTVNAAHPATRVGVEGASALAPRQGRYFGEELAVPNSGTAWRGTIKTHAARPGMGSGGADLIRTQSTTALVPPLAETFEYDHDGNLAKDGLWEYRWDAENRIAMQQTRSDFISAIGAANARRLEYKQDYRHRRVQKIVKGGWNGSTYTTVLQSTKSFYHGENLLVEYTGTSVSTIGTLARGYTWGLDLSGTRTGAGGVGGLLQWRNFVEHRTLLAMSDGHGNVVAQVNVTDGSVAASYEYDPYGETLRTETVDPDAAGNPIRFSSKYHDTETKLLNFGRRMYDPRNGRFLNRDPLGTAGGPNLYGFTANDPVNRVDPLGLELIPIVIGYKTECEGGEVRPDGTMTPFVCRPTEPLFTFIDVPDSGGGFGGGSGGPPGGGGGGGDTGGGSTGGGPNQPPPSPPLPPKEVAPNQTNDKRTDCEKYVDDLIAKTPADVGYFRRWREFRSTGDGLLNWAESLRNIEAPYGSSGFRPDLTMLGQGSQVVRHSAGNAGAYLLTQGFGTWGTLRQAGIDIPIIGGMPLSGQSIYAGQMFNDLVQVPIHLRNYVSSGDPAELSKALEGIPEALGNQAGWKAGHTLADYIRGDKSQEQTRAELIKTFCK